jgi:hypothetical protein
MSDAGHGVNVRTLGLSIAHSWHRGTRLRQDEPEKDIVCAEQMSD